jgi:hypothetical protein
LTDAALTRYHATKRSLCCFLPSQQPWSLEWASAGRA